MFVCLDCGGLFEKPTRYIEEHGLDTPPYEEHNGCPYCGEGYVETYQCDCCGDYIQGEYIKIDDDKRYCEDCYVHYELGQE